MTALECQEIKDIVTQVLKYDYIFVNTIPATNDDLSALFRDVKQGRAYIRDCTGWALDDNAFHTVFIRTENF